METVDLPPPYSAVINNTTPSVDLMPPEIIVEKPKIDEEPLIPRPFDDKNARMAFIQKILLCILLQAVASALLMIPIIRFYYDYQHVHIYSLFALIVYLATLGLLLTSDKARTTNPYKIIIFMAYPVIFAVFMGFSSLDHRPEMYLPYLCYCATLFVLLMYSVLITQTSVEYRVVAGMFISAVVLLALFGITKFISVRLDRTLTFYYIIGTFVDCSYILWDIQMMTNPKYRYALTPSDVILGVLLIRIDFIYYIFTYAKKYVLIIMGFKD